MIKLISTTIIATILASAAAYADAGAFLEITIEVEPENRAAAAAIYTKYKKPFLTTIDGAETKMLLVRDKDVQVLHGFETTEAANDYLSSKLFENDVVVGLKPFMKNPPDVRIYEAH